MALTPMTFEELERRLQEKDGPMETVQTLVWENESLVRLRNWEDWKQPANATEAQRALYLINVLTGQVDNGGLAQFLHNAPDLVVPTLEMSPIYNWPELGSRLQAVLDAIPAEVFEGLKNVWESQASSGDSFLESYADWERHIDDEAFNDWFYDSETTDIRDAKMADLIWRFRQDLVTG